jgi:hypothetical protein
MKTKADWLWPSWFCESRKADWDGVTARLEQASLKEAKWNYPSGEDSWESYEQDLWEGLVGILLSDASCDPKRMPANSTNLDFQISTGEHKLAVECVKLTDGETDKPASLANAPGIRKTEIWDVAGVSRAVETRSVSGRDAFEDDSARKQLRYISAIKSKSDQIAKTKLEESTPTVIFLNSPTMGLRGAISSRIVTSDCVNAVFGGSGVPTIELNTSKKTYSNQFDVKPILKKPTLNGSTDVARDGFLTNEFKNVSAILHCTAQPSELAEAWAKCPQTFAAELWAHSELIVNLNAKTPLPDIDFLNHAAARVSSSDEKITVKLAENHPNKDACWFRDPRKSRS